MQNFYTKNKANYFWNDRVEAVITTSDDKSTAKKVRKLLKKGVSVDQLKERENRVVVSQGRFQMTDKEIPETYTYSNGVSKVYKHNNQYVVIKSIKKIVPTQQEFEEVKGKVINEYQLQLEKDWLVQAIDHLARQHVKQHEQALLVNDYSGTNLGEIENLEITAQTLELPMKILAQGVKTAKFNLLQGQYKVNSRASGDWKKWRLAAVLAIIALFTTLIDKNIEKNRLQNQLADLKSQVRTEYKRAFPNAGAYRDLRATMTRQMKALDQGGASASVLVMLSQLEPAFAASKVTPKTMRFDSKRSELRIQAAASNFNALDTFKRQAESQGFTVDQGSINQEDQQVVGSLTIRS